MPREKRKFVAVDTEDDTKGNIYHINFFDGTQHFSFKSRESAVLFLEKNSLEIWSCQLEYDIYNIFGDALFDSCNLEFGDRLMRVTFKKNIFYDTLNHWQFGVKKMGEIIDLPKLESRYSNLNYCKRDTEIVYLFVKRMKEEFKQLGITLKLTCASTSFNWWHKQFYPIKFFKLSRKFLRYLKFAYYGGRTECFFIGKLTGNIKFFDVNSMYPFVMTGIYPKPYCYIKKAKLSEFGVTECLVESNLKLPVLPYRSIDGKLIFPNGRFRSYWSNTELRFAISKGVRIKKIFGGVHYKYKCLPFKKYIDTVYALRKKADNEYQKLIFKAMMNSLYGKFGQVNQGTRIVSFYKFHDKRYDKVRHYRVFKDSIVLYSSGKHYPIFTNMIWALETTARARIILYKYIERLSKIGKVLYCDTDSIFLNTKSKIKTSDKLGDIKLSGEYKRIEIMTNKFYRYGDRVLLYNKIKGIPYSNMSDFFTNLETTYKKPIRIKEGLRRRLPINVWLKHTKKFKSRYDKGEVLRSGEVLPLIL